MTEAAIAVLVGSFLSHPWTWAGATPMQRAISGSHLAACMTGPGECQPLQGCLDRFDSDGDGDVDLLDVSRFLDGSR